MEEKTKTTVEKKITKPKKQEEKSELIAIIRIKGMVEVNKYIEDTLQKLRLRRKYACVLVKPTKDIIGMIQKIKFYVAYGEINKETLVELLKNRAKTINNEKIKIDYEKFAEQILNGKKLSELGLKPFFRLHPPRKGIHSKLQYPKGVLGNNKQDINKLLARML